MKQFRGIVSHPVLYCTKCDVVHPAPKRRSDRRPARCPQCRGPMQFTTRPDKLPESLVWIVRSKNFRILLLKAGARLGSGWTNTGAILDAPRIPWKRQTRCLSKGR